MGATLSSLCCTPAEEGRVADDRDVSYSCLPFGCRCLAIETLYKVKMHPESDVDNEQWTQISDMIRKYDDEMSDRTLQELELIPDSTNSSIFTRVKTVSNAFDTGLLPHLQAKVELMKKLRDFLPEKGQSWEDFLMDNSTDILENVQPSAGLQELKTFKKLTTRLRSAIEGVGEDVQQRGVSQSGQKENKIKVFYATNRDVDDTSFTSKPTKILRYGSQQVSIPGVHKKGKVESPYKSGQGNHSKHFILEEKSGPWLKSDEFLKQIQAECNSANDVASSTCGPQKNAREVLLYIHGYTVSYNSALKRAAQLKNDLQFEGLVILYSWPTMGKPLFYGRDGKEIKRTAPLLREFITTLLGEVFFSEVHILAHSMGNRALIEALRTPGWEHYEELVHQRGVLKNVILAAADEALHEFQRMLRDVFPENLSVHRPIISVYSSACDWPLFVSGYINWDSRLGNTVSLFDPSSQQGREVDVIDASGVRCNSFLQHSYHAEAPEVLNDIQNLLTNHHRARDRPVIQRFLHNNGQVFHAFVPSWWRESKFNRYVDQQIR